MASSAVRTEDRFVTIDGLNVRYLEEGAGVPALILHGASLGSSADVFRRNLPALAAGGIRAITFDFPGSGKSDLPEDLSMAFRQKFVLRFADALGLDKVALIAHSQFCTPATSIALANPQRITHLLTMAGTGLLPPLLNADGTPAVDREAAVLARIEERMSKSEPKIEDSRALLENQLFHHELITEEELALRHESCVGVCFENFVKRRQAASQAGGPPGGGLGTPLWQRLVELQMPLLMIYGRQDRARTEERTELLMERYPRLDIRFAEGCKHLVPWDAADLFHQLVVPFLTR